MNVKLLAKKLFFLALVLTCSLMSGQELFRQHFAGTTVPAGWATTGFTFSNAGTGSTGSLAAHTEVPLSLANKYLFTETFTAIEGYSYTISYYDIATTGNSNVLNIYPSIQNPASQTSANTNETTSYINGVNASTGSATWALKTSTPWTCPVGGGGTYYFAFKASTGGVAKMRLDQIYVTQTAPACTAPGVPTTIAATNTTSATSFTANWTAGTGTTTDFYLDVATDAGFTSMVAGYNGLLISNAPTTSYNVTGLTEKTQYYYRVRARNTAGCINTTNSNTTTTTTACTTPGTPTANAASLINTSGFNANWSVASGTVTGYILDVATDNGFSSMVSGYPLTLGLVTTYAVTGLSASTTYYYRVRAINTGSCTSSNSSTQSATTMAACTNPGDPTATAATSINATDFTANWTAGSGTITAYQLDVATDAAFTSIVYTNSTISNAATSQIATGLTANTNYFYRVRAINGGCFSNFNGPIAVTTALGPCVQPTAQPTALVLTASGTAGINGSFTAASPAPAKYLVVRNTVNTAPTLVDGTTYTQGNTIGSAMVVQASNATTFSDSGLTANTTYYYFVYAFNDNCTSTSDYLTTSPLTGSKATLSTFNIWYVNKTYDSAVDVWCTAAGNDSNAGTTAAPFATLAKAIAVASNGDTIRIDADTYNDDSHNITKSLNIEGAGGDLTIFDNATGVQRWASINANNVTVSNLSIIRYALAADGMAINISGGTGIVFNKLIMYANVGSAGQGAIYASGAGTEVTFNNFSAPCNRIASANYGGAFKINGCKATFNNCSINNNVISAYYGGGIYVLGATADVTINKCTFDDNSAEYGGAMAIEGGTVRINKSCFNNNTTEAAAASLVGGGAIAIAPDQVTNVAITDCSFTNNSSGPASSDGGAITITNLNSTTITVAITTCSFTTNDANDKGEDIYFDSSYSPTFNVTLKNNTFNNTYTGTQVNLYNNALPAASIKFDALAGGGNGTISANGAGAPVTKPEMTGVKTILSSANPIGLPATVCVDRFDGACGLGSATFACETKNYWGDVASITGATVYAIETGANTPKAITAATNTSNIVYTSSGFAVNDWVTITGCNPATYNGFYKVTAATGTTFTVAKGSAPGVFISGGTATKGIPLGWSRAQIPTVYDHVILNYNYNTSTYGNIDACQLTVKAGITLTVDNDSKANAGVDALGTYVNVINSIFNSGTINVLSNGNLIQVNHPLDLNDEPIVTPVINFTKTTGNKIKWDYIYWSKPVTNNIVSVFNADYDLKYYWDASLCNLTQQLSMTGWKPLTTDRPIGEGFITRVKTAFGTTPATHTVSYSGTSTNGDYTTTVKSFDTDDIAYRNYALLGNPYPGAINFETFYNDNASVIYGTAYLWTAFTPYPGYGQYPRSDFATFNLTGAVDLFGNNSIDQSPNGTVPNGYIASGQGFMVRVKNPSAILSPIVTTVTFNNKQRTKDIPSNNQFYRTNATDKNRFWIGISDANHNENEMLIGYIPGSSLGFDEAYDAPTRSARPIKIHSTTNNNKLIIEGRGEFTDTDKVAFSIEKNTDSKELLTLKLNKKEGVFAENQKIYLFDKELNIYFDLNESAYTFYATSKMQNRFELVYKIAKNNSDVTELNAINEDIYVSLNNNNLEFNAASDIDQIYIYDINGKLILTKKLNYKSNKLNVVFDASAGIYITKTILTNQKTFTKKVIKN